MAESREMSISSDLRAFRLGPDFAPYDCIATIVPTASFAGDISDIRSQTIEMRQMLDGALPLFCARPLSR
jgi:hypothetical protein